MSLRRVLGSSFVVTGAAGFIGSHLVDALLSSGAARIVGLDDLSLGRLENLEEARSDPRLSFVRCDCSDEAALSVALGEFDHDACFNLAVEPLPASLSEPKSVVDRNVGMTTTICEALRHGRFRTLVQFSSSEVFGTARGATLAESSEHAPETPYAASKSATDAVSASYHRTFGLDVVIVRPFNTYGPRQNQSSYAGLIPTVLARIATDQPVVVDGDGEQTRDYIYVEDTVRGAIAAFERLPGDGGSVNIGSGREISVNAVVGATLRADGRTDHLIVHGPPRPGDVRRQRADIRRARAELAFEPETSFSEGIARTVTWYRTAQSAPDSAAARSSEQQPR
jgi:UDP-glucose 4-epimerase